MVYIACQAVATVKRLENLVLVNLPLIAIIDNAFETKVGLLPDENVGSFAMGKRVVGSRKVFLHLGSGHQAVAVLIYLNINDVALALFHAFLLFAERAEEILH